MNYLKITNDGLMDPHALSLMGASTKRGDAGKIGFFGTGNKYALAKFLSMGLAVKIYSGTDEISVTTKTVRLGDKSFDVVLIDGQQTSITTEMGPTWETWQAIREVYSNAMDEGNATIELASQMEPEAGRTHYYVERNNEIQEIMDSFDEYFATKREPLFSSEFGSIYQNGTATLYRKGIRCSPQMPLVSSQCDYDLPDIPINEERLAAFNWQTGEPFWRMAFNLDDASVFARIFTSAAESGTFESLFVSSLTNFPATASHQVEQWLASRLIATLEMRPLMSKYEQSEALWLPADMFSRLVQDYGPAKLKLPKSISGTGNHYRVSEPTAAQQHAINTALTRAKGMGLDIPYTVIVAEFANKSLLGLADQKEGRIVLAETVFSKGDVTVLETILEEWIHLKHDAPDNTREFQDAALHEFASMITSNSIATALEAA